MTIYVFSNAHQLTDKLINNVKKDIKKEDTIVLLNRMNSYHLFKGMDDQILSIHRVLKTGYKGFDEIKDSNIRNFIIFTRGHRQKEVDEEFQQMIKTKDPHPKRVTYLIDPMKTFIEKYGYSKINKPTTGPIVILYLDVIFPDEEKVLVGFSSHPSQKDKQNLTHDYKYERKFMLKYCKNKKFSFRYSILKNDELLDIDPFEFFKKLKIIAPERADHTLFSVQTCLF